MDQIYDGLLQNGVRPFVELSFMPRKLAAEQTLHPFWYKPIVSPPKDWNKWGDLVSHFAQHLVDRYGIDEVSQWYFEVWNEPNIDFWAGDPKEQTYYQLYDVAARALKAVNPRLRVGGPATAQAAWVDRFIRHCADNHVPVDFVSTHVYGNDTAKDVFGTNEDHSSRRKWFAAPFTRSTIRWRHRRCPNLPIIWSEYNASYKNEPDVTDAVFMGPWLADTIRQCDGLVDMLSYWTFSDVFEEQGVVKQPFYGGYGLIAEDGLPKPAFNAFKLLHRLGDPANRERFGISARDPAKRRHSGDRGLESVLARGARRSRKTVTLAIKGHSRRPSRSRSIAWMPRMDRCSPPIARWASLPIPLRSKSPSFARAAELPAPEARIAAARTTDTWCSRLRVLL